MLNCTDLACVLHHHHFYAHLHHLRHHLQNENDNTAIGEGSDVSSGDIQNLLNDTDSELSSLSHLDDPNDVLYTVCGVFIAMLLVGLIIILVAVTISKLRKREESSASPVTVEAQPLPSVQSTQAVVVAAATAVGTQPQSNGGGAVIIEQSIMAPNAPIAYRQSPASVWVFPPLPPQPNIYCTNTQDALLQLEKAGVKGFRKQFSGRFKRMVSRKTEPAPVIPPELKPQLKTIYVY